MNMSYTRTNSKTKWSVTQYKTVTFPVELVNKEIKNGGGVIVEDTRRLSKRERKRSTRLRGYIVPAEKQNINRKTEKGKGMKGLDLEEGPGFSQWAESRVVRKLGFLLDYSAVIFYIVSASNL